MRMQDSCCLCNFQFTKPANTKVSYKKPEDSSYLPLESGFEITSKCDSKRNIQLVITTASPTEAMNSTRVVVDKTPNPECSCERRLDAPPQVDRCLIGSWALDHGSVRQFWERNNRLPNATFLGSTGGFDVTFGADNVGAWSANAWEVSAETRPRPDMVMTTIQTIQGVSNFNYNANNGMACSQQTSSSMTMLLKMMMNGNVVQQTKGVPLNFGQGTFSYSCRATQFFLRVFGLNGQLMEVNYIFNRL